MQIVSKLKNNKYFLLAIISTFLSKFVIFLSNIIYSRNSEQVEFGRYSFFITNVIIISEFLTLGLNTTITQHVASDNKDNKLDFFKSSLTSLSLIIIIICILNYYFSFNTFLNDNIFTIYLFVSVSLITSYLNGMKDYKNLFILNVLYSIFFVSASLMSLFKKVYFIDSFKYTFFIFNLLFLIFYFFKYNSINIFSFNFKNYKIKYIKYTIPAFLSTIFVSPLLAKCYQDIVSRNGYEEFAILNVANQWKSIVLIAPMIFSKFLLSLLTSNSQNKVKFIKILKINFTLNLIITSFLSFFVFLFSNQLMNVFGIKIEVDNKILFFLVLSSIPTALNDVVGQAIASNDNYWYGFLLNLLWAIVLIICFYFIFNLNAIGFALSILIAYTILLFFSMLYSYKIILSKK